MTALVPAVLLLLGACAAPDVVETAPSSACDGLAYDDVRGREPSQPHGSLRDYPAAGAVCEGWWLDAADDFVPQGLEVGVEGSTAYVVGHRAGAVGSKPCQVAEVSLPTGRTRSFAARLDPPGSTAYCRHGGGAALSDAGLWVIETSRLWLLDPARLDDDPVLRVWQLGEGVRGSTIAAHDGQLVIGGYRPNGPGRARWYVEASVLARGVTDLVETSTGADASQVEPTRTTRVPPRLQGLALTPSGKPWHVSSRISCGLLHAGGRTVDFVPGAEDFEVTRDSIWVVSEASSSPYRDPAGALVPRLLRLDRSAVLAGDPVTCVF